MTEEPDLLPDAKTFVCPCWFEEVVSRGFTYMHTRLCSRLVYPRMRQKKKTNIACVGSPKYSMQSNLINQVGLE